MMITLHTALIDSIAVQFYWYKLLELEVTFVIFKKRKRLATTFSSTLMSTVSLVDRGTSRYLAMLRRVLTSKGSLAMLYHFFMCVPSLNPQRPTVMNSLTPFDLKKLNVHS